MTSRVLRPMLPVEPNTATWVTQLLMKDVAGGDCRGPNKRYLVVMVGAPRVPIISQSLLQGGIDYERSHLAVLCQAAFASGLAPWE